MADVLYYAYRSQRDDNLRNTTMGADPGTGDGHYIHAAGDVISFSSEEARDEYVKSGVVSTTLPDGTLLRTHAVHAITTERALEFEARCASSKGCIHKSHASMGTERVPAN